MTTVGLSLRQSLARTLRRWASWLDRLALTMQPPASRDRAQLAADDAAAAETPQAGGPPAHWLARAHRPAPAHWLAHIRRQAPHLLVGEELDKEAWLTQAAPFSLAASVAPEGPEPAARTQPRPATAKPTEAAAQPRSTSTLAPTTAAAQSTPRARPAPAPRSHPLRLRPVETTASAPRPGLAENALRLSAAPMLDVSASTASTRPAAQPRPDRSVHPLPARPIQPVASAPPAPTLPRAASNDASPTAPPATAAAASLPPQDAPPRVHSNRLPLPPVEHPPTSQPPPARTPMPTAPHPAATPKPELHTMAVRGTTAAPPPPRLPLTAATNAPPAPIAADPWPLLLPAAAESAPLAATRAPQSAPAWPTLPAWPEAAEMETGPDLRAWQRRQRLRREQRGLLWNE